MELIKETVQAQEGANQESVTKAPCGQGLNKMKSQPPRGTHCLKKQASRVLANITLFGKKLWQPLQQICLALKETAAMEIEGSSKPTRTSQPKPQKIPHSKMWIWRILKIREKFPPLPPEYSQLT